MLDPKRKRSAIRALLDSEGYVVLLEVMKSKKAGAMAGLLTGDWDEVLRSRAKIEVIDGLINELSAAANTKEE